MGRTLGADKGITVSPQDLYEVSETQRLRLGTKMWRGDCCYKYAQCIGIAITRTSFAVYPLATQHFEGAIAATTVVGATSITVTVGAHGVLGDGEFAKNELEGGRILMTDGSWNENVQMGIKGNTKASSADTMTIYLDGENPLVRTAAHVAAIMGNPYRVTGEAGSGGARPFMGVPMRICELLSYFWIQTWGPCWIAPATEVGQAAENRMVVFRGDGSLFDHDDGSSYDEMQHAGYLMTSAAGGGQGTPWIYLMCSC